MTFPISLDEMSLTMSQLDWHITPKKKKRNYGGSPK
jgi:hypothetical protein